MRPEIPQGHADKVYQKQSSSRYQRNFNPNCTSHLTQGQKEGIKMITARTYISADVEAERKLRQVVILQSHVRKWLGKQRAGRKRALRDEKQKAVFLKKKRFQEIAENERQHEINRRVHPKTSRDFSLLYSGLEAWRKQELKKIKAKKLNDHDKRLQHKLLLLKEAALIQQLCTLKVTALEEAREKAKTKWVHQVRKLLTLDGKFQSMDKQGWRKDNG